MGIGAAFRFDNENDTANLGADGDDNLNSLDVGGNVYKTPGQDLQVNVSPLRYRNRTGANPAAGSYAGTAGQAVTQSATNYVYLTAAGLVINTTGFPDPQTTEHIPLAEVVCSAVAVTSIADRRPRLILGDVTRPASYAVADLPAVPTGYPLALATDGRKTGEGGGAGTGVLCYWDGSAWVRVDDSTAVVA